MATSGRSIFNSGGMFNSIGRNYLKTRTPTDATEIRILVFRGGILISQAEDLKTDQRSDWTFVGRYKRAEKRRKFFRQKVWRSCFGILDRGQPRLLLLCLQQPLWKRISSFEGRFLTVSATKFDSNYITIFTKGQLRECLFPLEINQNTLFAYEFFKKSWPKLPKDQELPSKDVAPDGDFIRHPSVTRSPSFMWE